MSDPGAAFTLAAGENRQDLLFKLIPAAVIAGRVFDEDGEPMQRARESQRREYAEVSRFSDKEGRKRADRRSQLRQIWRTECAEFQTRMRGDGNGRKPERKSKPHS